MSEKIDLQQEALNALRMQALEVTASDKHHQREENN